MPEAVVVGGQACQEELVEADMLQEQLELQLPEAQEEQDFQEHIQQQLLADQEVSLVQLVHLE
jgi:hypothetical protein